VVRRQRCSGLDDLTGTPGTLRLLAQPRNQHLVRDVTPTRRFDTVTAFSAGWSTSSGMVPEVSSFRIPPRGADVRPALEANLEPDPPRVVD
jgi:hypothetical protein